MIAWKQEWKKLVGIVAVLALFFWLPMGWGRFTRSRGPTARFKAQVHHFNRVTRLDKSEEPVVLIFEYLTKIVSAIQRNIECCFHAFITQV